MHTTLKNVELLKHKISKTAPTCFGGDDGFLVN